MQAIKGNSLPGEPRQGDKSGYGKNASQQGALTNWRAQTASQDMERMPASKGTHFLESPDGETSQDTKTMNASQQGALTNWSPDRGTSQNRERMQASKGTHILESPGGETSQNMETM